MQQLRVAYRGQTPQAHPAIFRWSGPDNAAKFYCRLTVLNSLNGNSLGVNVSLAEQDRRTGSQVDIIWQEKPC